MGRSARISHPSEERVAEFSPGRGSPHHPVFGGEAGGGSSHRPLSFLASPPSPQNVLAPKQIKAASARSAPFLNPECGLENVQMSNLGKIYTRATKSGDQLEGHLASLEYNIRFRLDPVADRNGPDTPSHRIMSFNDSGVEVDIGAAWLRKAKRGYHAGSEFISLTFDDPQFRPPLNVAAFPASDPGEWDIVHRQRQSKSGRQGAQ
jgi:uncharacterized protein (DUF736 family)